MEQEPQTRVLNRDPTAPHPELKPRVATGPQAQLAAAGSSAANPVGNGVPSRVGRYELVRRLAHGGMATVYLGRASGAAGFEKVVAIKIIHAHLADEEDFLEMFFDEARIAAQIRHPHVVEILDLGSENGRHYMVMEWVEGETLSGLVRAMRPGSLPIPVILQVLVDTLEGLAAAHGAQDADGRDLRLVHRDVSPQNLLISMAGWLKVTDFGIVKAAGRHGRTRTGELRGKVAYMSPEQARGLAVDARSDLFAVGIIAWELLHAERLFARATDAATLERVISCECPEVSDHALSGCGDELGAGIRDWVAQALQEAPDARFSDARSMLDQLKSLLRQCGDTDARATLSSIMKSEFGERLAYVRAALRESTPSTVALAPDLSAPSGSPTTASTSLSAGIQEATGLASPKRAWAALVLLPLLGAGAAVAIAIVAGLAGGDPSGDSIARAGEGASSPTKGPAAAQMVHWWVDSDPVGASVTIDGRKHDQVTPTEIVLPKSNEPRVLLFEKEGMKPRELKIRPVSDQNVTHTFEPLAAALAATGATADPVAATGAGATTKKKKVKKKIAGTITAGPDRPGSSGDDSSGSTGLRPAPNFDKEGDAG
jgi:serine/threonine-protein kinase